jgi:hypothetical protein
VLPLSVGGVVTEIHTAATKGNGMNAAIGTTIHCVAAEPYATFMRIGLTDGGQEEVAYEIACVGRLRRGYRILQLRGTLGTRIELSCIFVRLSCGVEPNLWLSARHVRLYTHSAGCCPACTTTFFGKLPCLSV